MVNKISNTANILADMEVVGIWLETLFDEAISEAKADISNEHLWELGYSGEVPNPHTQNIASKTKYIEVLTALKATAKKGV